MRSVTIGLVLLAAATMLPAFATGDADIAQHVHIQNIAFDPALKRIFIGDTVTWDNHDGVQHTVSSNNGAPMVFNQQMLPGGNAFTLSFPTILTVGYHCNIHGAMQGTIEVYDPATIPNIAISSIETTLEVPGVMKEFEVSVTNDGNGPSEAAELVLQYYYDRRIANIGTIDVPALEVGDVHTETLRWDTSGKVGDFELLATLDAADEVFELDELDNRLYFVSPVIVGGVKAFDVRDPFQGEGPGPF